MEDYREANTRFLLQNNNWSGLIIDGSEKYIADVKSTKLYWKHDILAISAFITKDNINKIIEQANFAGEVGILSIDVDGADYWILGAINCVKADILIVKYNSVFGPTAKITVPYDEAFNRTEKHFSNLYFGASISALTDLANKKGYSLVGSNSSGNNLFFVSQNLLSDGKQIVPPPHS